MKQLKYLEGLDTLRFFLALIVLIGHCRLNLIQEDIYWLNDQPIFKKGFISVEYFFILSGFILTYISYYEIRNNGTLNIKKFFIRRALRILPLYYLCVFLGYFILDFLYPLFTNKNYLAFTLNETILYYIFLIPNYVIAVYREGTGSLFSLWSIGVEEQFYLFFPFLIPFIFKRKKPGIYLGILFLILFSIYYLTHTRTLIHTSTITRRFLLTFKFHFMILGALLAYAFIKIKKNTTTFNLITNKYLQIVLWVILIITFFIPEIKFDKFHILQGILFCYIIFIVSNPEKRIINIDIYPFNKLGRLSYGIYLFHPIVSYPVRFTMSKNIHFSNLINNLPILYHLIIIGLTIIIAHFSFQYFEGYFLKKKKLYKS